MKPPHGQYSSSPEDRVGPLHQMTYQMGPLSNLDPLRAPAEQSSQMKLQLQPKQGDPGRWLDPNLPRCSVPAIQRPELVPRPPDAPPVG